MPDDWREGRTLDTQDMHELRMRFTRLRSQLRYLYEREKHFGAQIAALESALAETRAALRLPLQGYATQSTGCAGLWPDGWAASRLSGAFTPARRTRELLMSVWVPAELGGGQSLAIELAGVRSTHSLKAGRVSQLRLPLLASAGQDVSLLVDAASAWSPAETGASADERRLAYKLVDLTLVD